MECNFCEWLRSLTDEQFHHVMGDCIQKEVLRRIPDAQRIQQDLVNSVPAAELEKMVRGMSS